MYSGSSSELKMAVITVYHYFPDISGFRLEFKGIKTMSNRLSSKPYRTATNHGKYTFIAFVCVHVSLSSTLERCLWGDLWYTEYSKNLHIRITSFKNLSLKRQTFFTILTKNLATIAF